MSQAQKKKAKKQKKKEEDVKVTEPAPKAAAAKNTSIQNLSAQAPPPSRDALPFETVTSKRAPQSKEERKQRERKDSLDDYSSGSESDVE